MKRQNFADFIVDNSRQGYISYSSSDHFSKFRVGGAQAWQYQRPSYDSVRRRWQRKGYVTINIVKGPSVSQNGCTREVREEMMGWDGASGGDPDRARTLVGGKAVGWQLWSSGILDLDHSLFTTSAPHSLSRLPRLSPLPHGRHHPQLSNGQYRNPLLQNSFFHCAHILVDKNDIF